MTTILQVGNFTRPWCSEVHFAGSLEGLGHTVHRRQENEVDWATIPDDADAVGAQVLLWTRTWPAELAVVEPVLRELEARGVPSVSYHLDRWFGLDREHQVEDQPFFRTSLVVSPDASPRWTEHGVTHLWLPPGVYGPECSTVRPAPRRWPFDVVFVGSHPYPHPEWEPTRTALIDRFRAEFGARFGVLPRKGQPVRGRQLQELYATVPVVLGDSCWAGEHHGYWSDRIPETLGRRGVLIHPTNGKVSPGIEGDDGMVWYENGRDLCTFPVGDVGYAVQLAKELLRDREQRLYLGLRGQQTVLSRDTYGHRLTTVLAEVEERFGLRPSTIPPPAPAPETARHRLVRHPVRFDLAQGDTDRIAVREVWQDDTYRLTHGDVKGRVVVDVGANVGAFSVLADQLGASVVYAYEPHPATFGVLQANVARLGRGGIECRQAAVGAGDGVARLSGDGGGATLTPERPGDDSGVSVPVEGIAGVLGALGGRCGLLKLDAEGAELGIIAAAPLELVDVIVGEWHGPYMPHLRHLADEQAEFMFAKVAADIDDAQLAEAADLWVHEAWSPFVARLVDHGRLELFGHPKMGGTFSWRSY